MPRLAALVVLLPLLVAPALAEPLDLGRSVVMRAAAVAETSQGFTGSTASITITSARNGSGHVFLDTFPLTEVDMQGSARLSARVASQITGKDLHRHDFFFVVRSGAEQIGGPSAGATMTVGAVASLNDWAVREDVLMTGTVSPDGTVGPVGGIAEKAAAARDVGVTRFLFPAGQEIVPLGSERLVNMSEYCRDELRIECIPVVDVTEAVGLMTDHEIVRPPLRGDVTGRAFLERLAPLSERLVDEAEDVFDEATGELAGAPEGAAKASLADRLDAAGVLVRRARNETANATYYTAASTSFQSSIESRYVREASRFLASGDRAATHAESVGAAREIIQRVRIDVEATPVQDTNSFETVGAAQVRLMEAEDRLELANGIAARARTFEDLMDSLYQAAYAAERAETAAWWLQLSEGFPKGAPVEPEALEEFARDTITTSTEEVAYVEAVFRTSPTPQPLSRSRQLLEEANEAMARRFYAAGMLSALDASVRASVVLEIAGYGGNVPASKFETAREGAARAIQGARARGAESLLAQSAYEFGLSLENEAEKLGFLGVARVTGNIAGLPGLFDTGVAAESRFQGVPPSFRVDVIYVAAAFAVGLALGAGAGLSALMPKKPEEGADRRDPAGFDE